MQIKGSSSPAVQWLRLLTSKAGGAVWILVRDRSHMLWQCCRKRKKNSVKSALSKVRFELLEFQASYHQTGSENWRPSVCDHVFCEL